MATLLTRPSSGEVLFLYLAVAEEAMSVVLIRETGGGKILIYFISKALVRAETRYQKIEKVAILVVVVSPKLKRYFLANSIVVLTDFPRGVDKSV